MPDKVEDLTIQVRRLIGTANALMERYARVAEELDAVRLALEELREILGDHFSENSRWADILSKRMDRVEQYTILSKIGDSRAGEITQQVTGEHIRRTLREELGTQQELLQQYQKNIDRVKLKVAKYGETVPLMNEMDDYVREIAKVTEAIERIREALNK